MKTTSYLPRQASWARAWATWLLPTPVGAVHQDRFLALDELVEDLGFVQLGVEREVKALEGLGGIEGGRPQAQAELALGAALDFVVQQHREEVDEGGLLFDGL